MNDLRPILYVIGILLCLTAVAMLLPMFVDLIYRNKDWQIFLFSSIITFFLGVVLIISYNNIENKVSCLLYQNLGALSIFNSF